MSGIEKIILSFHYGWTFIRKDETKTEIACRVMKIIYKDIDIRNIGIDGKIFRNNLRNGIRY